MEQLKKAETIALRNKHIGKSCQLYFRSDPIKIVKAKAQYMFDERGDAYLDCINNVSHVGHCHPAIVEAGCKQMNTLNTNARFLHDNIVLCAERLLSTMPDELSVCFFVNSGSEANDLALRLSKIHTGNKQLIALEHAYHGHLTSLIDISHYKFSLPGGTGQKDYVHVAPMPDSYRGKYRYPEYKKDQLSKMYAGDIKKLCDKIEENGEGVCAFIAESALSCGGQILLPPNYLKEVYKHVRASGGLCIADEVQTGFGRVGKWWAFQLQDVVPDIVTMGKPMGNGHPIAAVITTQAIADSFYKTGVEYFNTYGGNPVSCAIANAVFDTIEKENLREHAIVLGEYIFDSFTQLMQKHEIIGDVRGIGLFLGVEIVKDKKSRQPDRKTAEHISQRMREEHILLSTDGPECNVLKVKPPMVFTKDNADELVSTLDRILEEIAYKQRKHKQTESYLLTRTQTTVTKKPKERKVIEEQRIKGI